MPKPGDPNWQDPTALTTAQSERLREEMQREVGKLGELVEVKLQSIEQICDKLEKRVDEHHGLLTREIDRAEETRKEALSSAEATTTTALNKAENTLQVSLAAAKSEVQQALTEAEKRVNEKLAETASNLLALNEEKFSSIAKQFTERDVRTEQAASATKIAVDAALLAQKELVNAQNISNAAALAKSEVGFVKEIDGLKALLTTTTNSLNDKISALSSRVDRGEVGVASQRTQKEDTRADTSQTLTFAGLVFLAISVAIAAVALFINHGV
jgi:hypothetical protein